MEVKRSQSRLCTNKDEDHSKHQHANRRQILREILLENIFKRCSKSCGKLWSLRESVCEAFAAAGQWGQQVAAQDGVMVPGVGGFEARKHITNWTALCHRQSTYPQWAILFWKYLAVCNFDRTVDEHDDAGSKEPQRPVWAIWAIWIWNFENTFQIFQHVSTSQSALGDAQTCVLTAPATSFAAYPGSHCGMPVQHSMTRNRILKQYLQEGSFLLVPCQPCSKIENLSVVISDPTFCRSVNSTRFSTLSLYFATAWVPLIARQHRCWGSCFLCRLGSCRSSSRLTALLCLLLLGHTLWEK